MNSLIPEKSTISSNKFRVLCFEMPMIAEFKKMFSLPVMSGLKPAPSSSRAAIRPETSTWPLVGCKMPPMTLSSVLLPEPFRPISPTVTPLSTVNETSFRAQNFSDRLLIPLANHSLRLRSRCMLNSWPTPLTTKVEFKVVPPKHLDVSQKTFAPPKAESPK